MLPEKVPVAVEGDVMYTLSSLLYLTRGEGYRRWDLQENGGCEGVRTYYATEELVWDRADNC